MRAMRASLVSISVGLSLLIAGTASAQYIYQPGLVGDPATGEVYNVEFAVNLWSPTPELIVSSEALGIAGTPIDVIADLGAVEKRFPEFRLTLRPSVKHKLRVHYIPIEYTAEATLGRDLVYNGIRFDAGQDVASTLTWKAWRFAYEYDALVRDRGFFGVILEAKYTDVETTLESATDTEFARSRAPIPTLGAIARVYVMPNIAVTGEFTGIALPKINKDYDGHYFDFDIYGTVNFTNEIGLQVGYRSMDLEYRIKEDTADFKLTGLYWGGVVRF